MKFREKQEKIHLNVNLSHRFIYNTIFRNMGARMFRKGLAVAVILLFIGVAFAPSINASVVKDELVEFDVEFCGLGKKHKVKLTQQEADEVELLFDDIKEQLDNVSSSESR